VPPVFCQVALQLLSHLSVVLDERSEHAVQCTVHGMWSCILISILLLYSCFCWQHPLRAAAALAAACLFIERLHVYSLGCGVQMLFAPGIQCGAIKPLMKWLAAERSVVNG
jgi:uncharacterized membrane protein (GlpM family)